MTGNLVKTTEATCSLCNKHPKQGYEHVSTTQKTLLFCPSCWQLVTWEVQLFQTKQRADLKIMDWMRKENVNLYDYMQTFTQLHNRLKALEEKP